MMYLLRKWGGLGTLLVGTGMYFRPRPWSSYFLGDLCLGSRRPRQVVQDAAATSPCLLVCLGVCSCFVVHLAQTVGIQ